MFMEKGRVRLTGFLYVPEEGTNRLTTDSPDLHISEVIYIIDWSFNLRILLLNLLT